jgi:DNA-binding LacI/PurR family transcriptional regulator
VYWWLKDTGRRVPEEIAFVSLDVWPVPRAAGPAITGMNPEYAIIGRTAMEQLDLLLRVNQQGIPERPLAIHVPYHWVPGSTLPLRPLAAPKNGAARPLRTSGGARARS